jgi:2-polyprenyl-6-hydroxyphenyl methylase/3-demethylubiquinone-9 3-methyltransferase
MKSRQVNMVKLQGLQKHSQVEIFNAYDWWDQHNLLHTITTERCDYIESRVDRIFGREALGQQEVLEVGCGGGLISESLAQRGTIIVGIDPSQDALQAARIHTRRSGLGHIAYFQQGYAESLPYADGSFSVIVCMDVLEHVSDLEATIKEIARVLAPGGIFVFDTINRTLLAHIALFWIGERFFQKSGLIPGLHSYSGFIKPAELQALLVKNGLRVHEMTGFMPTLKRGRLTLAPGWFRGVSYIGYATKEEATSLARSSYPPST